jgi:hypothetical protein
MRNLPSGERMLNGGLYPTCLPDLFGTTQHACAVDEAREVLAVQMRHARNVWLDETAAEMKNGMSAATCR